ncbi:hypothetical protein [Fimbriiglobus ruber]|uniref:Outer membrane protein beta-barrel domain-containing protein n=1 Tax=Fimbriiglobus ruber TaxID=1908690 RepID=A0A225DLH8_9BACT|nr:hypothetical protein [Fimbriiglobus ruber]OWK38336.1 hypothetical protein FRUB_07456 [Fimbriiglobus ruber]
MARADDAPPPSAPAGADVPPAVAPPAPPAAAGPGLSAANSGLFNDPTAFNGIGGTGNLFRGPQYSTTWYAPQSITGQGGNLGYVRQELSVPIPIWSDGGDVLMATGRLKNLLFETHAVLPPSGRPFPEDLWDMSAGLNYVHKFDNGWTGGVGGQFGSASDKPFNSLHEITLGGNAFLRVPAARDGDWWMFSLSYSPNGQVAFPIPGVAYSWAATDRLRISIGLPLALTWRPVDDVYITMTYVPLNQVRARATWIFLPGASLYTGFEWSSEGFFLADRTVEQDRFFVNEKRLMTGVRYSLTPRFTLDVSGGYAFDRSFGSGTNSLNLQTDRVDVANTPYLSGSVFFRY